MMLPQKWHAGASLCTLKADPIEDAGLTAAGAAPVTLTAGLSDPALD
jgi:hypothetical protein